MKKKNVVASTLADCGANNIRSKVSATPSEIALPAEDLADQKTTEADWNAASVAVDISIDAVKLLEKNGTSLPDHIEDTIDMVNKPAHYTQGGIECIDAIRAALTPEEFRGYCKGNVLKYTWREKYKGGNQSLEKAAWYLREVMA